MATSIATTKPFFREFYVSQI